MEKKMKTALALLFVFILAMSMATVAFADSEKNSQSTEESTSNTAPEKEDAEESDEDEPTGFLGLVNGWIKLRENGGLVTKAFGTEYKKDGKTVMETDMTAYVLTILLCAVLAYFLGSLNFGVIVSKKYCHDDVRSHGSGNAGMTNVARTYGAKPAVLTFLGDAGKAVIATVAALVLGGNGCGFIALVFCMVGHAFPCFFGFKGGKGVSTCAGGMLILEPVVALILCTLFILIVVSTKYVSLGSVIAAGLLPVMINSLWLVFPWHAAYSFDYFLVIISSVAFACFIIWLHRGNIKRLYYGEERKIGLFSKKKKEKR